jgi:hypothetical protein
MGERCMSVTAGEPITYVEIVALSPTRWGLKRGRVDFRVIYEAQHEQCFCIDTNASPIFWLDTEGQRWIRGHHLEKSAEGSALLAAYKLVRSAV